LSPAAVSSSEDSFNNKPRSFSASSEKPLISESDEFEEESSESEEEESEVD